METVCHTADCRRRLMRFSKHYDPYQIMVFEWPPRGQSHDWMWPVLFPSVGGAHLYVDDLTVRIDGERRSATLRIHFSFQNLCYRSDQVALLGMLSRVMGNRLGAWDVKPDSVRQGAYIMTLTLPEDVSDQMDVWGMKLWHKLWLACGHANLEQMPVPRLTSEWWQNLVIDGVERPVDRGEWLHRLLGTSIHA